MILNKFKTVFRLFIIYLILLVGNTQAADKPVSQDLALVEFPLEDLFLLPGERTVRHSVATIKTAARENPKATAVVVSGMVAMVSLFFKERWLRKTEGATAYSKPSLGTVVVSHGARPYVTGAAAGGVVGILAKRAQADHADQSILANSATAKEQALKIKAGAARLEKDSVELTTGAAATVLQAAWRNKKVRQTKKTVAGLAVAVHDIANQVNVVAQAADCLGAGSEEAVGQLRALSVAHVEIAASVDQVVAANATCAKQTEKGLLATIVGTRQLQEDYRAFAAKFALQQRKIDTAKATGKTHTDGLGELRMAMAATEAQAREVRACSETNLMKAMQISRGAVRATGGTGEADGLV